MAGAMKLFKRRLDKLEEVTGASEEDGPIVIVLVQLDDHGNAVEVGRNIIEKPTDELRRQYSRPITLTWGDKATS
jgi:hypothetical protein